jgi:hypothetical protein
MTTGLGCLSNYSISIDKSEVRDLKITKQELTSMFIDPRTELQPPVIERHLYGLMHPPTIQDNWLDGWFMVFDNSRNNRDGPLYFLRK